MVHYKLAILYFITIFSLIAVTPFKDRVPKNNNKLEYIDSSIVSLITHVKSSGWNNKSLDKYTFYLINSISQIQIEKERLNQLPESFEKTFLQSILLKKELSFPEMFDSLYSQVKFSPNYLRYYDELVVAANASGQAALLDGESGNINITEPYKSYTSGLVLAARGEYKEALKKFEKTLETDTTNYFVLYQISYMHRNLGNYPGSLDVLHDAVSKAGTDELFLIKAAIAEGTLNYLSGDYKKAKVFYERALSQSRKINDRQNEITCIVNLGILLDHKGDTENARKYFNDGLSLAQQIQDAESEAFALSETGVSFTNTNNIIEAKQNYLKSYLLYKKLNDHLRLSLLSGNIAKLFVYQFNYQTALEYYEKGIEYAGDNKYAKALCFTGMADVYANLSNYSKAIWYYRAAQDLSAEIKELSLKAQVYNGIGALYFNLNRYPNALKYFSEAEQISRKSADIFSEADVNYKLGLTYLMSDSLDIAGSHLLKAVQLSAASGDYLTEALSYANLASLGVEKRDFTSAQLNISKAMSVAQKNELSYVLAECYLVMGEISRKQRNFNAAMANYNNGLKAAQSVNEYNIQIEAYKNMAELCRENHLTEAAGSYYSSAINLVENISRPLFAEEEVQISYFSGKSDIYNSLADFYLEQGKYKEAFEIIDKARSRSTVQNLVNLKLKSIIKNETLITRLYDYEWVVNSGIYDKAKTDSVKILLSVLRKNIITQFPDAALYLERSSSSGLQQLQNSLSVKENLVSIYTNDQSTHVFLVKKNSFLHFDVGLSQKDIHKFLAEISPYYSSDKTENTFFNQDLFSFNADASNRLYKVLFAKVFDNISEKEKVIISPSAELLTLPAEMFVVNLSKNESPYRYSDKDFLVNHYSISYTPSAAAFIHQKNNTLTNKNKALVVGDPAINTSYTGFAERRSLLEEVSSPGIPRNIALLPLKYSAEEVNQVGDIINAEQVLIDSRATESNFKQNAVLSRIIHLSTHSFLYNKQPVIFFSNIYDEENDGFLEASEIVQLQLNSDLVVLSSCNSGLGVIDNAEGILGMTKAFYEAGAKSIVVSLWEVNDKYTSKFMALFYNKLSEGYDKSEALRLAKLDFIRDYSSNPYYWAAFVLSGNTSTLPVKSSVSSLPYISAIAAVIFFAVLFIFIKSRKRVQVPSIPV